MKGKSLIGRSATGVALLLLVAVIGQAAQAIPTAPASAEASKQLPTQNLQGKAVAGYDLKHDRSAPLASLVPDRPQPVKGELGDRDGLERPSLGNRDRVTDTVAQRFMRAPSALGMPRANRNFDGIYNYWGYVPPDTNGDVGPNNYFQIVNAGFQIYDKSGNTVYGPANTSTLWRGFGGICESNDDGDPVVLYDPLADRWMVTQFAVPGGTVGYHQCMAISTSGNPTGSYYRYDFLISQTLFNDYPHYGVWPDGYYCAFNMYRTTSFAGAEPVVFDRVRMLQGLPASFQYFPPDHQSASMLPADFDGQLAPPEGAPNTFAQIQYQGSAQMQFFNFHVDWANPSASSFTPAGNVDVAPFNTPCLGAKNCIPQAGTPQLLDALADRLMYRLAYRNFGDHQTLVTNHTVDLANGQGVNTGVRWYEFRSPGGSAFAPSLYQQGTFAPDSLNRWMGSVAMDHNGNIAAGYSTSSAGTFPDIRYAGRLAADPLGELAQGEALLISGGGSQTSPYGRWGDYSMMAVDPSDDCTFWFTTEYLSTTAERSWRTRVGAFKFRGCDSPAPSPTPGPVYTPTPLPAPTATPCAGSVTYNGSITLSDPTVTGRLARDGVPSTCAAPKTCPGQADSNVRHYDSYQYTNTSASPRCVTVSVTENCGNNALLSAAYLGTFNPSNVCQNYLADMGIAGPTFSYSFTLPANSTAVVTVLENSANIGCAAYTLRINPCAP